MNKSDAERLAAILEGLGYQKTDNEKSADLIAVVACSVRQSAVDRIYGKIKIWNKLKKNKKIVTLLTGCVLKSDQKKLSQSFDLIFDIKNLNKLPKLLKKERPISSDYFSVTPKYQSKFQAYVPISTGCNNYCTYCVVPYARGPEISRPAKEIINEVKSLINSGYKETTLLGQNVNSYYSENYNFPKLLKTINDLPGNFWLNFVTSHPKDLSDELIKIMANGKKICQYMHLPVQAGDNKVLKAMNRHYTSVHYKNLIKKIRKAMPDIAISTDIIVGFPKETKAQFNNTAKLMKQINFDMAYLAEYSPRPGTAAAKLEDNVPAAEKSRRWKILNEILKKSALKNNKNYLKKIVEVLINNHDKGYFYGKTKTFKTVKIKKSPNIKIGDIIKVKIIKAADFCLEGVRLE